MLMQQWFSQNVQKFPKTKDSDAISCFVNYSSVSIPTTHCSWQFSW